MMSALIHLTRLALCSSCSSMAFLVEHLLSGCPHQPLCTVSLSVDSRYIKTMWRVLNQNLTARLFHIWSSANLDQCFTWSINLLAIVVLGKMIINIQSIRINTVPRTWIWFYSFFIFLPHRREREWTIKPPKTTLLGRGKRGRYPICQRKVMFNWRCFLSAKIDHVVQEMSCIICVRLVYFHLA